MRGGKFTRRQVLRLGAGSTIAFSVLGLAACAAPAAPEPTTAPAAKQAEPTKPAAEATKPAVAEKAPAGGKVELTHWYHQYGEKGTEEAVLKYAKEYEGLNPNVKVTVVWTPGNYGQKLAAALAAGEGVDVYEGMPNVAALKANQIAPLDDIIKDAKDDFDKKDVAACSIKGKVYSIKMIDDTGTLYYRKSILEKAGVKPPTNWEELVDAAKKLTTRQQKGLFLGNDGGISALSQLGPYSAGANFIDDSGIKFNVEPTVKFYEALAALQKDNTLLTGSPTDWWDPAALIQSLTAMQWGGLWAYPELNRQLKEDFGVVPWPAFDSKVSGFTPTPVTFWGGWSQMANGQGKNVDAAKALIKWMWIDNTKIQTDWALAYGFHVPPRLSVAKTADPLKSGRTAEIVKAMYDYGRVSVPTWTDAMGAALTDAASNIVKLGKSAKEEVAAAAKKCEAELAAQQV